MALLAACGFLPSSIPQPTANEIFLGTVRWGCAPHDGPALELSLEGSEAAGPVMAHIILWDNDFRPAVGRNYIFDGSGADGIGTLQIAEQQAWLTAARTQIRFSVFRENDGAEGSFSMDLLGDRRVGGRFKAEWDDSFLALCG